MKIFRNRSKLPEELLYLSFDSGLNENERNLLDQALEQSPGLRKTQKLVGWLREIIGESRANSFDPFFADRVMQQIYTISRATEDFVTSLLWSFRRVAIPGLVCLVLLVGHNFINKGKISTETILSLPQLTLEESWPIEDLLEGEVE